MALADVNVSKATKQIGAIVVYHRTPTRSPKSQCSTAAARKVSEHQDKHFTAS